MQTEIRAGQESSITEPEPVVVEDLTAEARFDGPPLPRDHGVVSGSRAVIADPARPNSVMGASAARPRAFNGATSARSR